MAIGEAWAQEMVRALRSDDREILGAWPGTITEAKMRVLVHLSQPLAPGILAELARAVTVAARREWFAIAEGDPEM